MPFQTIGEICTYQFGQFDESISHAFFTRKGGLSPEPWATLNMGGTVGDEKERVKENRMRGLAAVGREPASVYDVWQVHGIEVAIAKSPRLPEAPHLQADVILTDKPGITLMMRFADCVPIMLHDPVRKVVGIVHAGWMGTVLGTVKHAVAALENHFGSNSADIKAAIGPSIGPDHYEVGPDVVSQVLGAFGTSSSNLIRVRNGRTYFDLWAANHKLLVESGVSKIELAGLCTACHVDDWYSHRAEKGHTGRFGAFIALE
jgi:YfiH family protein